MQADYEPAPFLRVTIGAPILSADYEKIGKVKEIHGQYFKVETGLFQRDFWLPAETVAEATPDDFVVLTVEKGQIDDRKSYDEPSQLAA